LGKNGIINGRCSIKDQNHTRYNDIPGYYQCWCAMLMVKIMQFQRLVRLSTSNWYLHVTKEVYIGKTEGS